MNIFSKQLLLLLVLFPFQVLVADTAEDLLKGGKAAERSLAKVLASPESTDSLSLITASLVALQNGHVEDAGFLYFSGQIRARTDLEIYKPLGKGGDSPAALLGAMSHQAGYAINPEVMRDRVAYGKIVDRLKTFIAQYGSGYSPGWEYVSSMADEEAKALFITHRNETTEEMIKVNTILSDDIAYQAVLVIQNCNLGGSPDVNCPELIIDAMQTVRDAESRLGVEGTLLGE